MAIDAVELLPCVGRVVAAFDGFPRLGHERLIMMQIVDGKQARSQRLTALE
jgi:hypothetical protein